MLSVLEMFGAGGRRQSASHILEEKEIVDGGDELGVFLYGHKKNAYWYGSQLSIEEARKLAPYQNATGMQVLQETGLVNGHQRAQPHGHRGELPECPSWKWSG